MLIHFLTPNQRRLKLTASCLPRMLVLALLLLTIVKPQTAAAAEIIISLNQLPVKLESTWIVKVARRALD